MKHRKLFQATNCSNICDLRCPFSLNCIPFPGLFPPPSPPPPPPPPHNRPVSPYVIIFVSLVGSFLLFVACRVIVQNNGGCGAGVDGHQQVQSEAILDEHTRPTGCLQTVGLEQSIINSITACKYKKDEGLIDGTQCSICLNEIQEDETVRLLPKCNHAFHISCIDTWLRSNAICPMCRASIVPEIVTSRLAAVDQNLGSSNSTSGTHAENSEMDRELGDNRDRNREACQNRTRTEDAETIQDGGNSNENGVLQVLDDSGDDIQAVPDDGQVRLMRSVSLDSSLGMTTLLGLTDFVAVESGDFSYDHTKDAEKSDSAIIVKQDGAYSGLPRLTGDSSTVHCLHKGPVSMKRSLSCSSRFFG